jgi:mRNA interferase MazF
MTTKPSPTSDGEIAAGAVVVVPFPYSDRHAEKRRPAVVVTGDGLARTGFVWVSMITTAKRGAQPHDIPIDDLAAAGLTVPCLVRPTKIACIEPYRILRRSGRLSDDVAGAVFATIRSFIAERP